MDWILANTGRIAELTLDHAALSLPAVLAAFLLSVPLAVLANRLRPLREPIVSGMGLLYAVPSLPLFIVLPIILGTGIRDPLNAVAALTLFGMALMVRSAAEALDAVSAEVRLAAAAQGCSSWGRIWTVDLPLAGPAMLAGLRVVSVSTISLATVSAVLGVPSLGSLFTDGFQRGIMESVLAGVVMTVVMALILDLLLVLSGRLLMPWARRRA